MHLQRAEARRPVQEPREDGRKKPEAGCRDVSDPSLGNLQLNRRALQYQSMGKGRSYRHWRWKIKLIKGGSKWGRDWFKKKKSHNSDVCASSSAVVEWCLETTAHRCLFSLIYPFTNSKFYNDWRKTTRVKKLDIFWLITAKSYQHLDTEPRADMCRSVV